MLPHLRRPIPPDELDALLKPRPLHIGRHGKTKMNNEVDMSEDHIRSWLDVPLTDEGREQARQMAEKVKALGINAIVASNLSRAKETADIVGAVIGVKPTYTKKLRPWDLGIFTGQSTKEAMPKIAEYICDRPDDPVPDGESFHQFKDRAFEGFYEALADHPGMNVLIITHHRNERLLMSWDRQGQPGDHTINLETFRQRGDPPGGVKVIETCEAALKGKMSHQQVGYRYAIGRDQCSNCKAYEGINDCKKVVDPIYPSGWCRVGVSIEDGHSFDIRGSNFNEAMKYG